MPKIVSELTDLKVRNLKTAGFYAVGGAKGLYLRVSSSDVRSWIMRYSWGIKRRDLGLGSYPTITLKAAREKARQAAADIDSGIDPIERKQSKKATIKEAQTSRLTFKEAALRCHLLKSPEFRNDKHRKDWISTLERHAFPTLGKMPVASIETPHILKMLEPIWQIKTETATRVRQRTEAVLTWATVSKYRSGENPARWDSNLKELLPNPSKIKKVIHFSALPWQQLGEFLRDLRKRPGTSARALEFAILTAARSGEIRGMTWSEIDLQTKVWTIPENRIKAGKLHKVPLSDSAIGILKALPRFAGQDVVFLSNRGKMLSDAALLSVLKRMGLDAVPHGFRSTFKDWARNCANYPDEVSELALAHVNSDSTRAAYARDELLPQRAMLMADWAGFCNQVAPQTLSS